MNSKTAIGYITVAIVVGIAVSGGLVAYYSSQIASYQNQYNQAVSQAAKYKALANFLIQHMNVTYSQGISRLRLCQRQG